MNKYFYILYILTISIFFIFIKNNNYTENFITWYNPFYNKNATKNIPKYLISNYNYSNLKYFFTKDVKFYVFDKKDIFTERKKFYLFLFKMILRSFEFKNSFIDINSDFKKIIENVNNNENTFGLVPINSLYDFFYSKDTNNLKLIKNINTIINIAYQYLFIVTLKNNNIITLKDLNNKIVNIGEKNRSSYFIANNIIENSKIYNNINIKKTFFTIDKAFDKLFSKEIDCLMMTDIFPSPILNQKINDDFYNELIIIPLSDFNEKLFKSRHPYLYNCNIDFNLLPEKYLPIKLGDFKMTYNRPYYNTYKIPRTLICNKNTNKVITYNLVKSINQNLNLINESELYKKNENNKLFYPDITYTGFIPLHIGAKNFYTEIGIYTDKISPYCKYYVGKEFCSKERALQAKIIT